MGKKIVADLYSIKASCYEGLVRGHPGFKELREEVIKSGSVREGEKVLDIGAGTGYYGLSFVEFLGKKEELILLDISEEMLRRVPKELSAEKTHLVTGDAEYLPFKDQTFDILLCINVLRYTAAEKSIKEMSRVLKPKGRLIIIDGDRNRLFSDLDSRRKIQERITVKHRTEYLLLKEGITKVYSGEEIRDLLRREGFGEITRKDIRIYFIIKAIR